MCEIIWNHKRDATNAQQNHFSLIILEWIIFASVYIYSVLGCHFASCFSWAWCINKLQKQWESDYSVWFKIWFFLVNWDYVITKYIFRQQSVSVSQKHLLCTTICKKPKWIYLLKQLQCIVTTLRLLGINSIDIKL